MIREAGRRDLELLLDWRMETLEHVFAGCPLEGLRSANRRYYQGQLGTGHIACFALDRQLLESAADTFLPQADSWQCAIVGCGALCLQQELPSPDNPSGRCGYLMNIYVREPWRHQGYGHEIVQWLMDQAWQHQAGKIWLESSEAGKPLYRDLGFADMEDIMVIEPARWEETEGNGGMEHDGNSENL